MQLPHDKQVFFSFGQLHVELTTSDVVVMHLRGQSKKLSEALRYSRIINFNLYIIIFICIFHLSRRVGQHSSFKISYDLTE